MCSVVGVGGREIRHHPCSNVDDKDETDILQDDTF